MVPASRSSLDEVERAEVAAEPPGYSTMEARAGEHVEVGDPEGGDARGAKAPPELAVFTVLPVAASRHLGPAVGA